jgi:hypothetical protein
MESKGMDWIQLAQDKVQWQILVNSLPKKMAKFLPSPAIISYSMGSSSLLTSYNIQIRLPAEASLGFHQGSFTACNMAYDTQSK